MPPKKAPQLKEVHSHVADADSGVCELTTASMETILHKYFAEADKQSKDRFDRLENQLVSIKTTLEEHSKELDSQRKLTTSLRAQVKRAEDATTEHSEALKKLQEKLITMEDQGRRSNLRIINLKEGVEHSNALSYLLRIFPTWFPELATNLPEFTRAHRVGRPRSAGASPRHMIFNCLRLTDRDRILGLARKTSVVVDGHTIRFTADYSDFTARLRRPCFPVMNRARTLGFEAFLLYPAVIKFR